MLYGPDNPSAAVDRPYSYDSSGNKTAQVVLSKQVT